MPRINIEEEWFMDPRRDLLIEQLGCLTDSIAIKMWRLSQNFHREGQLVPVALFERVPHWQEFEGAGLAERRETGVYIKGSAKHFQWLLDGIEQRREAGKKSAEVRKEKYGSAIPHGALNAERAPNEHRTTPNGAEPSSSSSSSKTKNKNRRIGIRQSYSPEFEILWEQYKKIGGKAQAYETFLELKLSEAEIEDLKKAIPAYLADCKLRDRSEKHFSTFLREDWRPWLEKRSGQAKPFDMEAV